MKVLYQAPVDQLSGHDGYRNGLVAFRSNGIDVLRRHVVPNNPDTDEQRQARLLFTLASQAFSALTDAQRAAFATYAQLKHVDVMGRKITLQDMAAYVRTDWLYYLINTAHTTAAPTSLPGFTASAIENMAWDSTTLDLTFNITHNGVAAEGYWLIKVTPAMASAQRMGRPSDFRLVLGVDATSCPAVIASEALSTITDALMTWGDADWMEMEVTPVGIDYSTGTPYRERTQISVTP